MPFVLEHATEGDSEAIVHLQFEACAEDPGFSVIFPNGSTPEAVTTFTKLYQDEIRNDPTCHVLKVSDQKTGDLASFAIWYFLPEKSQDQVDAEMLNEGVDLPSSANQKAGTVLIRNGYRKRHEIMGGRAYAYLASIGTASKYRAHGAASLSIEWGTKLADEKGLPGYVEGTPSGTKIYQKYGFEIVDRLKLELYPWNDKDFWNVCMVRSTNKLS